MNPWIAMLIIGGSTGLVAYLSTRKRGSAASTHSTNSEVAEK